MRLSSLAAMVGIVKERTIKIEENKKKKECRAYCDGERERDVMLMNNEFTVKFNLNIGL